MYKKAFTIGIYETMKLYIAKLTIVYSCLRKNVERYSSAPALGWCRRNGTVASCELLSHCMFF